MSTSEVERRLAKVSTYRSSGLMTSEEFDWLRTAIVLSARGSGGEAPRSLDLPCISAPVADQRACLSPAWIGLRCHHGNETWRVVRCRWCEGCRHAWRARVRAIILTGCMGARVWMWTLTVPEYPGMLRRKSSGKGVFDVVQARWHALLRDAQKDGLSFQYLRVVELQKRGTPHFHLAVKNVQIGSERLSDTGVIGKILQALSRSHGFGYVQGKTFDFQAARLGGQGVASYMSKYLEKSEDYNELRREDGRAIRRYCRSHGWSPPRPEAVWRYARIPGAFSRDEKSTADVRCDCGEGQILNRDAQAQRWLVANRRERRWVAPIAVADYLFKKEEMRRLAHPGAAQGMFAANHAGVLPEPNVTQHGDLGIYR